MKSSGLTPLLDTLFLLLFALLAVSEARSQTRLDEVHVRLPEIEPGEPETRPSTTAVAIDVDADSRVMVSGAGIATREELDRALAVALGDALPEEVSVEIRADADARHGVTVELLQHLRLGGFADVRMTALGVSDSAGGFGGRSPR